jgi:hypothetical protein
VNTHGKDKQAPPAPGETGDPTPEDRGAGEEQTDQEARSPEEAGPP